MHSKMLRIVHRENWRALTMRADSQTELETVTELYIYRKSGYKIDYNSTVFTDNYSSVAVRMLELKL